MPTLNFLIGDATLPIKKPAIIAHICNDIGGWGKGFVVAISKRFGKGPESSYRKWWATSKSDFKLGNMQFAVTPDENISIANMIAQKGLINNQNPKPIDYVALKNCLCQLYVFCKNKDITVHMPRIGCGLAGGKWEEIEPIIKKQMTVDTYVYDFELR
jgi:O-acetyl-ADP-ribose deacetylase (regulator of RNase III)